jgi:hypothetical protein
MRAELINSGRPVFALPALLLLISCGYAVAPQRADVASIDSLQWLVGEWVSEGKRNITYESWQNGVGGLDGIGRSKSRESGEIKVTETLQLITKDNEILYVPTVAHNPGPVAFRLMQQVGDRFVFENPEHDFPKRIVYERIAPDQMRVTVSGDDAAGFAIEFRRLNPH